MNNTEFKKLCSSLTEAYVGCVTKATEDFRNGKEFDGKGLALICDSIRALHHLKKICIDDSASHGKIQAAPESERQEQPLKLGQGAIIKLDGGELQEERVREIVREEMEEAREGVRIAPKIDFDEAIAGCNSEREKAMIMAMRELHPGNFRTSF